MTTLETIPRGGLAIPEISPRELAGVDSLNLHSQDTLATYDPDRSVPVDFGYITKQGNAVYLPSDGGAEIVTYIGLDSSEVPLGIREVPEDIRLGMAQKEVDMVSSPALSGNRLVASAQDKGAVILGGNKFLYLARDRFHDGNLGELYKDPSTTWVDRVEPTIEGLKAALLMNERGVDLGTATPRDYRFDKLSGRVALTGFETAIPIGYNGAPDFDKLRETFDDKTVYELTNPSLRILGSIANRYTPPELRENGKLANPKSASYKAAVFLLEAVNGDKAPYIPNRDVETYGGEVLFAQGHQLPHDLKKVILKGLSKEPKNRPEPETIIAEAEGSLLGDTVVNLHEKYPALYQEVKQEIEERNRLKAAA